MMRSIVPLGRAEFLIRMQAVNDLPTVSRPYRAKNDEIMHAVGRK